jgi:hypothetical protein
MKRIALILAFAAVALAQQPSPHDARVFQSYIDEHLRAEDLIDSVQPDTAYGQCEEYRTAREEAYGDLNHDGTPDAAVVYTIEGGGLGNSSAQYLAVFVHSKAGELQGVTRLEVNGSRGSAVTSVAIRNNIIYLKGLLHQKSDPMCCPTGQVDAQYEFVNGHLKPVSASASAPPAPASPTRDWMQHEPSDRGVWFHAALETVSLNMGINPIEFWAEVEIQNTNTRAETVTVTARRYNGKALLSESYTIDPGETRTIRIDDPSATFDSADGQVLAKLAAFDADLAKKHDASALRASFRATVLVEPMPPGILVKVKQLALQGNKLITSPLDHGTSKLQHPEIAETTRAQAYSQTEELCLSNLSGEPKTVLVCEGILSCTSTSRRITLAPFATISEQVATGTSLFVTKPAGTLLGIYHETDEKILSIFNADSNVTFGATVPEKK